MSQRSTIIPRVKAVPLLGVLALALMLAGCGKCSDFLSPTRSGSPQTCKDDAPLR
jgi:hypothetical protein